MSNKGGNNVDDRTQKPPNRRFFQVANSVYQNDPYWLGESARTIQ